MYRRNFFQSSLILSLHIPQKTKMQKSYTLKILCCVIWSFPLISLIKARPKEACVLTISLIQCSFVATACCKCQAHWKLGCKKIRAYRYSGRILNFCIWTSSLLLGSDNSCLILQNRPIEKLRETVFKMNAGEITFG